MKTTKELMDDALTSTTLNILVFGPQVAKPASDDRTRNLQNKRVEIRARLEDDGHIVRFAEDIVDPSLPAPANNAFLQEMVIMQQYDLIITLVDSPGSIAEATLIATKPQFARKASLFLDHDHRAGLVGAACEMAKSTGATYNTYEYPKDLVECNLVGHVKKRVADVQLLKFLS